MNFFVYKKLHHRKELSELVVTKIISRSQNVFLFEGDMIDNVYTGNTVKLNKTEYDDYIYTDTFKIIKASQVLSVQKPTYKELILFGRLKAVKEIRFTIGVANEYGIDGYVDLKKEGRTKNR